MLVPRDFNEFGAGYLQGQRGTVVTHRETGRAIAPFRCTQIVLYAKTGA